MFGFNNTFWWYLPISISLKSFLWGRSNFEYSCGRHKSFRFPSSHDTTEFCMCWVWRASATKEDFITSPISDNKSKLIICFNIFIIRFLLIQKSGNYFLVIFKELYFYYSCHQVESKSFSCELIFMLLYFDIFHYSIWYSSEKLYIFILQIKIHYTNKLHLRTSHSCFHSHNNSHLQSRLLKPNWILHSSFASDSSFQSLTTRLYFLEICKLFVEKV